MEQEVIYNLDKKSDNTKLYTKTYKRRLQDHLNIMSNWFVVVKNFLEKCPCLTFMRFIGNLCEICYQVRNDVSSQSKNIFISIYLTIYNRIIVNCNFSDSKLNLETGCASKKYRITGKMMSRVIFFNW